MTLQVTASPVQGPPVEVAELESPCINTGVVDQVSGWCRGCYRTLAEISRWSRYTHSEKLAVLNDVAQRKAATPAA